MRRVPHNPSLGAELVPLFRKGLELNGVKKGDTVLAFTDSMMIPSYPAAVFGACGELEADVFQITVPSNGAYIDSRAVIDAWKAADLVVGMTATVPWLYSDAHNEALDGGTRTLMIEEPEDILRRLFPSPDVKRRTLAGQKIMQAGSSIRITSAAGTDLRVDKTGRPGAGQYGISDVPGRWDRWPSGLVATAPHEESAEGVLVIDVGDILLSIGRYVETPIRVTVHDGRITDIEGAGDASLLRDFIEAAKDPNAYVLSHIGWGTDDRVSWATIDTRFWEWGGIMDAESYHGNMLIAFGTNMFRQLGGANRSRFHLDIPTRGHSFWIDDELIIDGGTFTNEDLR